MSFVQGTMLTNSTHIKQNALCKGFHSPLLRARPALKLRTLINQTAASRTRVIGYNPQVSCQHGRQITRRSSPTYTPEVCTDDDTPKPVSAWQKLASFILKSTAVAALAFALVSLDNTDSYSNMNSVNHDSKAYCLCSLLLQTFGSVMSAEAARSGGRMGGSGFSAARSGSSSYSR